MVTFASIANGQQLVPVLTGLDTPVGMTSWPGKYIFGLYGCGGNQPKVLRIDSATPDMLAADMSSQLGMGPVSWPQNSLHGVAQDCDGEIYLIRVIPPSTGDPLLTNGTLFKVVP
ncbi:MAG: hypothetical protein O2816_10330 [Planctomycetota bacterium]|nr:hypothetical protein [Planctomycetota bacterium]